MKAQNNQKPIIYQLLPRLFVNYTENPVPDGTIEQNGSGKLIDINETILSEIKSLGATHIWYTGVLEHSHTPDYTAFGIPKHNPHVIKGKAGSPYAITDYYDIDPDLAKNVPDRIAEFESLVERTHKAGLKVIIDFVPNHVAREYHSDSAPAGIEDLGHNDNREMFFSPDNNFFYITRQQFSPIGVDLGQGEDAYVEFPAKASGNDCYTAFPGRNDWYDTVKLNYGVDPANGSRHFDPIPPTWLKMLNILRYWASKGVDGFRCDMAHMVPVDFWRWAIPQVKAVNPDLIFIAEIYDVALYRTYIYTAGFDYLYDKVNLYDTLRDIETAQHSAANLTSCWQTVEGISDRMLNFLENHDEQRFASEQYAGNAWNVVPSLVVSSMLGRGAFMLYAGQELGEPGADAEGYSGYDGRTTIFDYWSVAKLRRWLNRGDCRGVLTDSEQALRNMYMKILNIAKNEKAVSDGEFFDLMYVNYENPRLNPHRHYAFLRYSDGELLIIIANFSNTEDQVAVNIPAHAFECLNIPRGAALATELITGVKSMKTFTDQVPFLSHVPSKGAVIWKIKTSDLTDSEKESKKAAPKTPRKTKKS